MEKLKTKIVIKDELIKESKGLRKYLNGRKLTIIDQLLLLYTHIEQINHSVMHDCLESEEKHEIRNPITG